MEDNISIKTGETFAPAFFTALAKHGVADEAMARRATGHPRAAGLVGARPVLQASLRPHLII
jgi:hypothetical protein